MASERERDPGDMDASAHCWTVVGTDVTCVAQILGTYLGQGISREGF
jgi:hypothetical protein